MTLIRYEFKCMEFCSKILRDSRNVTKSRCGYIFCLILIILIILCEYVAQLNEQLAKGECVRISTGAAVPASADAVVQVEDTQLMRATDDGKTELEIVILKPPSRGQDIRWIRTILCVDIWHCCVLKRSHCRA